MNIHPHRKRLGRLRESMEQSGVAALLVSHPPNLWYLCGFTGDAGVLLVERTRATLLTDSRFKTQAAEELGAGPAGVKIVSGSLAAAAASELVRRRPRGPAAFEAARTTVAEAAALRKASQGRVRWRPVAGWVERLRMVKEPDEIERMREAARLGSEVMGEALELVRPGVEERELAAEIEYRMRRRGAGASFETIVASGPRAALPHARATSKAFRENELVVIDMGAILRHYCSDLTRTVYLGRAPSKIRRWYRAVLEAQTAAIEALRPGSAAGAADHAARQLLAGYGLDRAFVHGTGHGLGIEVHEEPRLGRGQAQPLEASMVVTVEPGIYLEGRGGIRIEDDVLILPGGTEVLTGVSREFLEL